MQTAPFHSTVQQDRAAPVNGTIPWHRAAPFTLHRAAKHLGVSLNTLRRKIAAGEVRAIRVERPQGHVWQVYLDPDQHHAVEPFSTVQPSDGTVPKETSTVQDESDGHLPVPAAVTESPDVPGLVETLALIERQQQTILELAARCGYLRADLQQAREQLALTTPQDDRNADHQPAPLRRRWWHLW